ncbi:hypothetical protein [Radicibacter daui]|uniref:hypothetical protein n=1 Tax=Radicibacter daui TaxID=3064829 RepID=UPI004046BFDD
MLPVATGLLKRLCGSRPFLALLVLPVLFGALAVRADAQQQPQAGLRQVDWYLLDLPPSHIRTGPDAGQGTGDTLLRYFMQSLQGFNQQERDASLQRVMIDAAKRDGVCAVSLLYTAERQKVLVFSRHRWRLETGRVLYRRQDAARFAPYMSADQRLDLVALGNDRRLAGGFVDQRVYSTAINGMIAARVPGETLYTVDSSESAVRMMALGRLTYMFGYPFEVRYLAASQNLDLDLLSAPAAGDPIYRDVRTACSRGQVGEKLIAAVDALLDSQPLPAEVVEAFSRWIGPTGYVFENAPDFNN